MKRIEKFVAKYMPAEIVETWDNIGLLVGSQHKKINKVLLALDMTAETFQQALNQKVDLIFAHHPLIFDGIFSITDKDYRGRLIRELTLADINLYVAHTNWDNSALGASKWLANEIGLVRQENIEPGYCAIGYFDVPKELGMVLENVKEILYKRFLVYGGSLYKRIKKVCIVAGSGKSCMKDVLDRNCDLLITGDMTYHAMQELVFEGIAVIDGSHFATERYMLLEMKKAMQEEMPDIEVLIADEEDVMKLYGQRRI